MRHREAGKDNQTIPRREAASFTSIELFSGAGGSALGVSRAGFLHRLVTDWDKPSCDTLTENNKRGVSHVREWPILQDDVKNISFTDFPKKIDLLAGGPPCQPFSLGGKHRGQKDNRDMFPEMVRAVRELRPKAVFIENVRGLIRESFAKYYSYIILQLTYPELVRAQSEDWLDHLKRLERHHTRGAYKGLYYRVVYRVLNAADYGVPQHRERVIIVGFRSDLGIEWSFPSPTHSKDALIQDQWVTGDYWERHRVPRKNRPKAPSQIQIRALWNGKDGLPAEKPWRTVRDALYGLPLPASARDEDPLNHFLVPGARRYPGHTGSSLDQPSKTIKAGVHGVPGGENMVNLDDGRARYYTIREAARIQTFPDAFVFPVSWSESMRQIGNAVPVALAEKIGWGIREKIASTPKYGDG